MAAKTFEPDTMTLFTHLGERKYLDASERKRFYKALTVIRDKYERCFIELIFWTGCRISEALGLVVLRVNVEECFVVFQTLKQHGKSKGQKYRIVHVPSRFMKRFNRVHSIDMAQADQKADLSRRLWRFGRQKGWRLVKQVMTEAGIFGVRATPRGLRHSFGVHCILSGVPAMRLQEWMGHSDIRTTSIYVRIVGVEDRDLMKRFWKL